MPRLSINYQNSIIYKIACKDPNIKEIYIGSTTHFINRKNNHKSHSKNPIDTRKVYVYINANGGWDNFDMVLVEKYPCADKLELFKQERHYIDLFKSSLNSCLPYSDIRELKGKKTKYDKIRREGDIREVILEKKKIAYALDKKNKSRCTCGSLIMTRNEYNHKKTQSHKYIIGLFDKAKQIVDQYKNLKPVTFKRKTITIQ